jgi:hypothetical protein
MGAAAITAAVTTILAILADLHGAATTATQDGSIVAAAAVSTLSLVATVATSFGRHFYVYINS